MKKIGHPQHRTTPTEFLIFSELDEPVQVAARWIAEHYVRNDSWPSQVEFARFCFRSNILLESLRQGNWHDVFDGTIGFSVPEEKQSARVRAWILYDLGVVREAFQLGHECFIRGVERLAAGPDQIVTVDDKVLPPLVPISIRRLVGQILSERHSGSGPDESGAWSVMLDMHDVKRPLPDLQAFVSRPIRRVFYPVAFQLDRGPKPTLWAFVSSTYEDLKPHREATLNAALRLKVLPLGMELWPASPKTALRYCLDELAVSDLMLLIIGRRYGSVTDDGRSFTEIEYEQAKTLELPIYVFLPAGRQRAQGKNSARLLRFISRLQQEKKVAQYGSVDDLRSQVIQALSNAQVPSAPSVIATGKS